MKKPRRKCKSGWRRELGTSKQDQGIVTPKRSKAGRYEPNHNSLTGSGPGGWSLASLLTMFMSGKSRENRFHNQRHRRRHVFKNRQGDR